MANLYEIMGLPRYASIEEVRHTFRRLAVVYHPDKNPGNADAEEKFKELSNAYDVLGDEKKKSDYDLRLSGMYILIKQDNPEEKKRKRAEEVQRMRQKIKEREENEIKALYEKAKRRMPYRWRYILLATMVILGMVLIINNWYLYNINEARNMAFFIMLLGFVMIACACVLFLGSLFVRWNAINIDKPFRFDIRSRIANYFYGCLLFLVWFSYAAPGYFKQIQLYYYGDYTVGIVVGGTVSNSSVEYVVNGKNYSIELVSDKYKYKDVVVVKYSKKRPYIIDVVRKISYPTGDK